MPKKSPAGKFASQLLSRALDKALNPGPPSGGSVSYKAGSDPLGPRKGRSKGRPVSDPKVGRKMVEAARSAQTSILPAPVSAGMMMRGTCAGFGTAPPINGVTGVRISGRQIWATLANGTASGASNTNVILPYGQGLSGTSVANLTFDPDDTATMPAPLTSLGQIFARYCLRRCRIVYTPACPTSTTQAVAFAVNTDAGQISRTAAPLGLTIISIMEQSNSVAGPCWAMMSIDVPCDNVLRYTFQSASDASLTVAEERQDHAFGVIAATDAVLSTGSAFGYFHMEYTCDFYELQSGANESSLRRLEKQVTILRDRFRVEQKSAPPSARAVVAEAAALGSSESKERAASALGESVTFRRTDTLSDGMSVPELPRGVSGGWSLIPKARFAASSHA
jgi:hypothetical protein